jgi:hypothetical protein
MKKYSFLGVLLLLVGIIGALSSGVYADELNDFDKDGVSDDIDLCPNLKEDNDLLILFLGMTKTTME